MSLPVQLSLTNFHLTSSSHTYVCIVKKGNLTGPKLAVVLGLDPSEYIFERLPVVNVFYNLKEVHNIALMVSSDMHFICRFSSYSLVSRHNTLHVNIVEMRISIKSDSTGFKVHPLECGYIYLPPLNLNFFIFMKDIAESTIDLGNIKYYNHRSM